MAALPAALAIGATGLQVMGGLSAAQGQAAGYRYAQDRAERLELNAKTAANETDTQLREELGRTLGQIQAIRAAANTDGSSPTAIAIEDEETRQSDRQRRIKVGNLNAQASQYGADAEYYGYAGGQALQTGYLNAFATGIKGLAGVRAG